MTLARKGSGGAEFEKYWHVKLSRDLSMCIPVRKALLPPRRLRHAHCQPHNSRIGRVLD